MARNYKDSGDYKKEKVQRSDGFMTTVYKRAVKPLQDEENLKKQLSSNNPVGDFTSSPEYGVLDGNKDDVPKEFHIPKSLSPLKQYREDMKVMPEATLISRKEEFQEQLDEKDEIFNQLDTDDPEIVQAYQDARNYNRLQIACVDGEMTRRQRRNESEEVEEYTRMREIESQHKFDEFGNWADTATKEDLEDTLDSLNDEAMYNPLYFNSPDIDARKHNIDEAIAEEEVTRKIEKIEQTLQEREGGDDYIPQPVGDAEISVLGKMYEDLGTTARRFERNSRQLSDFYKDPKNCPHLSLSEREEVAKAHEYVRQNAFDEKLYRVKYLQDRVHESIQNPFQHKELQNPAQRVIADSNLDAKTSSKSFRIERDIRKLQRNGGSSQDIQKLQKEKQKAKDQERKELRRAKELIRSDRARRKEYNDIFNL